MKFLASLAAVALLAPWITGCASPAPPRPPSLNLPAIVTTLTAQRIGNTVELHWTTTSRTTDDLDISGNITAELCRETLSSTPQKQTAKSHPECLPVDRLAVHPGPSQATDDLPVSLTENPVTLLAYRVQLFNATGHSAGQSSPALSVAGTAPPPVQRLNATVIRSGVRVEWQPEAPASPVELVRTLIPGTTSQKSPQPVAKPETNLLDVSPKSPTEVRLLAANQPVDTGGVIDRTARKTFAYNYTAQRVRTVMLSGHTLELRSLPSQVVTVVMRDVFPPAAPSGLAAIPATSPHGETIDLSWEPVPDPDVAGYIVYRQTVDSSGKRTAIPTRLTATPVAGPAFSDSTAIHGQRYSYFVTAIDSSGNESAPSANVEEIITEP